MQHFRAALGLAALAMAPFPAAAQSSSASYPVKPVRMIVPFVPGGPNDIVGRAVARKLEESLGQQVVIDNRGGANGTLGTTLTAKAAPDGYTIGIGSLGTLGISPSVYPKLGYDVMKDFEHIATIGSVGNALIIHPSIPAKNLRELIALAKKNPGKLNYASVGSTSHLMAEMLNSMAGIQTVHIPYKGASPALVALLSGEVDYFVNAFPGLLPHIQAGRLRALAVTTDKRSPLAPDVPTMLEAGLPGYNASTWYSLVAPAGTPRDMVTRINQATVKALRSQDLLDSFAASDTVVMIMTPEQTTDFARSEIAKWAKVVKAAGVKPE
ncbi:MAG: Bug family tripartite tricarboxylate transporter substrate binding protein [Burkholderiales bacterium]